MTDMVGVVRQTSVWSLLSNYWRDFCRCFGDVTNAGNEMSDQGGIDHDGLPDWPEWWDWELEFTLHIMDRMIDRYFTEVELRSMMEMALRIREDREPGRWIVEGSLESHPWEIIVEPDLTEGVLVVVTAYPVEVS